MGYDYSFRLALNSTPDNLDDHTIDDYVRKFREAYLELNHISIFENLGKICHGSGDYCTGGDEFKEDIILFTAKFSEFEFLLYHCYWDMTQLSVYKIKNSDVELIKEYNYETISVGNGSFTIDLTNIRIEREITGILTEGCINENYDNPFY